MKMSVLKITFLGFVLLNTTHVYSMEVALITICCHLLCHEKEKKPQSKEEIEKCWTILKESTERDINSLVPLVRDANAHHYALFLGYAKMGNAEMVRSLLSQGVPLDVRNRLGATALHLAAFYGHGDVVVVLMQHEADPTIRTLGKPPLVAYECAQNGRNLLLCNRLRGYTSRKEGCTIL